MIPSLDINNQLPRRNVDLHNDDTCSVQVFLLWHTFYRELVYWAEDLR
jgi:hypothetical protein